MKIKTSFDYPPIPFRGCDWSAIDADTYDMMDIDEDGTVTSSYPVGRGATEAEAIADLLTQMEDVLCPT